MAISQFSWARSHYDAIVTSYINGLYLFWYQWKEDVHTYRGKLGNGEHLSFEAYKYK